MADEYGEKYNPDAPYAGTASIDTEPKKEPADQPILEPRSGWFAWRGSEQHGVQQVEEQPMPLGEEYWSEEGEEIPEPHIPKLRQQEPLPVVDVWSKEQTKRIIVRTRAYTLPRNQWTEVLGINHRRTMLSFWVNLSPQGTDLIYFQSDSISSPLALCPRIQDGGQQLGMYQFMFTNKLYMYAETTTTDYVVNVMEEYEIEV